MTTPIHPTFPIIIAAFVAILALIFVIRLFIKTLSYLTTAATWCYNNFTAASFTAANFIAIVRFLFGGFAMVRYFSLAMLVTTYRLSNQSKFVKPLSFGYSLLMKAVMVLPGALIFPYFSRRWPIKQKLEGLIREICGWMWLRSILFDLIKGGGAILCFYGTNSVGSFFNSELADLKIIQASLTYVIFLLSLDVIYDFEDVIEVCDNAILAGYGLIINSNQTIVKEAWVHFTCVVLNFIKNYIRSNIHRIHNKLVGEEAEEAGAAVANDPTTTGIVQLANV